MESVNESLHSEDNSQGETVSNIEVDDEERKRIRDEISKMSFEDLQKLKYNMGSKLYNETVYGVSPKKVKTNFSRANKNRPREASSKIQPTMPHVKMQKNRKKTLHIAPVSRDPRFDPLCGAFEKETFNSNYKFVNEIKKKEKKQLLKEYEECEDPRRKKKIKLLIQRIDNQVREHDKKEVEVTKKKEEKRAILSKLKRGEKPTFKKKSEKRIEDLVEKYEQLKKTNKLHKHIEKKSRKLATKMRKKMENEVAD